MTTHTLNGFSVLIPDIPEGATGIGLSKPSVTTGDKFLFWWVKEQNLSFDGFCFKTLPPGDWQLFKLSEVPESLAGEMVEKERDPWGFDGWMNYDKEHSSALDFNFDTAHASLTSWVRAQGHDGNPYLLIKKD